jgi:hypothetical protein
MTEFVIIKYITNLTLKFKKRVNNVNKKKTDFVLFFQPYADDASIYSYDWRVQDSYTGQDFGQGEVRQGFTTDGEYQVI